MVSHRQLSFRSCFFGTLFGIIGCFVVYAAGFVLASDLPSTAALFIPTKLGLVDTISDQDITTIEPGMQQTILLPKGGKYELYTHAGQPTHYDIAMFSADSGEEVRLTPATAPIAGQATRT